MSLSSEQPDPRYDFADLHIAQDLSHEEEMGRLLVQDRMLTAGMGGVLVEQPHPIRFERVLDVGCGPGGWLLETALTYPQIASLVGIDISSKMLSSARAQTRALQLEERVEFQSMDAQRMLAFPVTSFDLANLRTGISWLRKWDWPKLVQELRRVLRRDGTIRLTDLNGPVVSNSAAMTSLWALVAQSFLQAGTYFAPDGEAFDLELTRLLEQYGFRQIQTRKYTLEYHPDTLEGQLFIENMRRFYHTIRPFLQRWTRVPTNYDELYQQMLTDTHQPDFTSTINLFTIWSTKSLP